MYSRTQDGRRRTCVRVCNSDEVLPSLRKAELHASCRLPGPVHWSAVGVASAVCEVWQGVAWCGMVWHGVAGCGRVW